MPERIPFEFLNEKRLGSLGPGVGLPRAVAKTCGEAKIRPRWNGLFLSDPRKFWRFVMTISHFTLNLHAPSAVPGLPDNTQIAHTPHTHTPRAQVRRKVKLRQKATLVFWTWKTRPQRLRTMANRVSRQPSARGKRGRGAANTIA